MKYSERIQELMNKGIAASKEALAKAGGQAQTWGEMGLLRIEIVQKRSQAEKLVAQLGAEAYACFGERGEPSLWAEAPKVHALVARIQELEKSVDGLEERYRKLGGKDSDLEEEA
ncbi:MAG TPA: hypothetical protein VFL04_02210 [Rectinemataceae bacterium]|nr:hypothetical protein [Rectinemataceae bacterium]